MRREYEPRSVYGEGQISPSNGVYPRNYEPDVPYMYSKDYEESPSAIKQGKNEVEKLLGYSLEGSEPYEA